LGAEGLLLGELYARVRRPPPQSPPDDARKRNEIPSTAHRQFSAARGSRDDNDSLAGLIITFFCGICLEQNLGPDLARITKKIDAFMRLIRAI